MTISRLLKILFKCIENYEQNVVNHPKLELKIHAKILTKYLPFLIKHIYF